MDAFEPAPKRTLKFNERRAAVYRPFSSHISTFSGSNEGLSFVASFFVMPIYMI